MRDSCPWLLRQIRPFRMKNSKWPFFVAKKQMQINPEKGGRILKAIYKEGGNALHIGLLSKGGGK